ncbi:TetR/AcrR family transcriptional regulator [Pseudovibrio sp. Tun.PSC04-5.I4]|uniref:TetR/AcrR family transcriptional regulator n=1 Tax=Pseudovibrio sp. Tun.PSC04-5.I4 TaxID=1798213 RepID=UPI00088376DA|nr:TetR/AcrR family transcriptional regulator [Pseudovibrio sp. Tun.PSC04-5.I4]SDR30337.1 DNA-binding transcriptional regulator, AcrR family [Pseudovibrio sp. Tun.PSC04-5.I4]
MARTKGSVGADTQKAIFEAARGLIETKGFGAMTLRQLAAEVGLQPGSIYRYFASKDALLQALMNQHMTSLIKDWELLEGKGDDPVSRLRAFVGFHIRYHIERRADVIIANLELRALGDEYRADVVEKRSHYEANLRSILAEGVETGVFPDVDLEVAAYAIIAMLTGVCFWYRPDGRLNIDEIISIHQKLVVSGVVGGS